MKITRMSWLAAVLLLLSFAVQAADEESSWWNIPYPGVFDSSSLTQPQTTIKVESNGFVDEAGKPFVFRGVNIADPDKLYRSDHWNKALFEELSVWGANTVRLPIHPIAWRGRGSDWFYERIDEAVVWANSLGMYLIIDWHSIGNLEAQMFQHPMYITSRTETDNFWAGIAHRYKGVATVAVYELFNEPTNNYIGAGDGSLGKVTWQQWRQTQEELIDLVRVYDPTAIPLVAGFNWAYDLSHIAQQPIRREGVAYAIHPYPQKAKPDENTQAAFNQLWQQQWGYVADQYPMIATELGWTKADSYGAHVPVINNDGTYGPNLVSFMEERQISWIVWCFDPDWGPTMIEDWDFTPTEQGRFFKEVLQRSRDGSLISAVMPSPRVTEYSWMSIARWQEMHAQDVEIAGQGDVDLLLLGDSITQGWTEPMLAEYFTDYKPANFGISGDRTENLRWRLLNGASGKLDPKVVVIMIGVNNFDFGDASAQEVFKGVEAVVGDVRSAFENAQIVLLGILPYGEQAGTPDRQRVGETNELLAGLAAESDVDFYDIGDAFLQQDGSISPAIMADFLHPTEKGYEVFAEQLAPVIQTHFK